MTLRKPAAVSWTGFVEQQIREAQSGGQFDNLKGQGKPLACLDEPVSDDWWLKAKLKDEQLSVLPPLLEAKLDIQRTRNRILEESNPHCVRDELQQLAARVKTAIMSPLPSPPVVVLPIDVEAEMLRWERGRAHR